MNNIKDPKKSKGQLTSHRILEATARCIAKIGIEKTSITAIALEAGLKRPLIAYHFPKKNRIFYHVADLIVENLRVLSEGLKFLPAKKQYLECLRTYIRFFNQNPTYFNCFQHFLYQASINREYKLLNTEFRNKLRERLLPCLKIMIKEKDLTVRSQHIFAFLDQVFERLIGASIHFHTVEHAFNASAFLSKQTRLFQHELHLFLELAAR